jgi:hypothetical protein
VSIADRDGIDGTTIHAHPLSVIRLRYEYNGNRTRAQAFANIPFGEEMLYLSVDLLGLFGVGAVGGTV